MEKYLFMKKAVDFISNGEVFKKIYALILRVSSVLIGLAGLVAWFFVWKEIFSFSDAGSIIGGILAQILFVVFIYAIIHDLLIRAENIEELPHSDYTITPIMSVSLKLFGEIYALLIIFVGIAGGLFNWLSARSISALYPWLADIAPHYSYSSDFLGGLYSILFGVLGAFGALVIFYFLSEMVIVLIDIARNTRR